MTHPSILRALVYRFIQVTLVKLNVVVGVHLVRTVVLASTWEMMLILAVALPHIAARIASGHYRVFH